MDTIVTPCGFSRRTFLASSAVTVAGTLHSQGKADNGQSDDWIDAHVHVWTPDRRQFPLASGYQQEDMQPPSFTPDELMQHAEPVGVRRVVLIQMSFYGFDNSYMLKVIRDQPQRFVGVAVIDPSDRPVSKMKKHAEQGVRGFRLYHGKTRPKEWLRNRGVESMWSAGADQGLAMCLLMNPEYLPEVIKMCQRFPRTPVVIDHFARLGIDGKIREPQLDNLCRLADFEHVTVKTSAFYALGRKQSPYEDLAPMIRRLRGAFGAPRLMWASDCPYQVQAPHTYADSINLIKSGLDFLSPEEIGWILRGTAQRVYFHDR